MGDFNRYWILDGDRTTAGGTVIGSCAHIPVDGRKLALEGDQVKCPACNSMGVIECVPPIRRSTAQDGRQFSVDGDLCMCACSVPPKLLASQKNRYMGFSAAEIAANPAALSWFSFAGHRPEAIGLDHSIQFHVLEKRTNKAMDSVPYKVTLADGSVHLGVTDANGMSATIYTSSSEPAKMEIPYHDDSSITAISHTDGCSC